MQYTVKHTCGHVSTQNLFGKGSERESRLAWLRDQPCLDCKRGQETKSAVAATATLPALVGSEKQVAWATTIRAKQIAAIDAFLSDAAAKFVADPNFDEAMADFSARRDRVANTPDARFWIDRRDESAKRLLANA